MVTRSRASARQHGLPRIASAPTSSPWPRLPAELLGRIASACESCAALRAMDALDRSLWSTRVERLLGALRCTPTEPLLLHVRHVARRATPALVSAGGAAPVTIPLLRAAPAAPCAARAMPHALTPPGRAPAAGVVPVLVQSIAHGHALPSHSLQVRVRVRVRVTVRFGSGLG